MVTSESEPNSESGFYFVSSLQILGPTMMKGYMFLGLDDDR
jgi:hypothetical protein